MSYFQFQFFNETVPKERAFCDLVIVDGDLFVLECYKCKQCSHMLQCPCQINYSYSWAKFEATSGDAYDSERGHPSYFNYIDFPDAVNSYKQHIPYHHLADTKMFYKAITDDTIPVSNNGVELTLSDTGTYFFVLLYNNGTVEMIWEYRVSRSLASAHAVVSVPLTRDVAVTQSGVVVFTLMDVDRDHTIDIVVADTMGGLWYLQTSQLPLLNLTTRNGSEEIPPQYLELGVVEHRLSYDRGVPLRLLSDDLSDDGYEDLLVVSRDYICVFVNTGNNSLEISQVFETSGEFLTISFANVDNDNATDFLAVEEESDSMRLRYFINNGSGHFEEYRHAALELPRDDELAERLRYGVDMMSRDTSLDQLDDLLFNFDGPKFSIEILDRGMLRRVAQIIVTFEGLHDFGVAIIVKCLVRTLTERAHKTYQSVFE